MKLATRKMFKFIHKQIYILQQLLQYSANKKYMKIQFIERNCNKNLKVVNSKMLKARKEVLRYTSALSNL